MLKCAIIGSGPTAIYTLKHLLDSGTKCFDLTMFEKATIAGKGMPYGSAGCSLHGLSNSSSIEIPDICQSFETWLMSRSETYLQSFDVKRDEISDQNFYPRIIIGDYFADQLRQLVVRGNTTGHRIRIKAPAQVLDLEVFSFGTRVNYLQNNKKQNSFFSKVAIATGHVWPQETARALNYYSSPWPISKLDGITSGRIGIRGSSLSAIETAIHLASKLGQFERTIKGEMHYQVDEHVTGLHLTLFSRKGILPEADFYADELNKPLNIFEKTKIKALCAQAKKQVHFPLLENLFDLFKEEILFSDPDYAKSMNLEKMTVKGFYAQYFKKRMEGNIFRHAKENLVEAQQSYQKRQTFAWRFAMIRMVDFFTFACPYFTAEELQCFNQNLKPIFIDNYSCIPHESVEKIIALHEVGRLDVLAVGNVYTLNHHSNRGGALLKLENGEVLEFQTFIDAAGQSARGATGFPFKTLISQGIIKDAWVRYASNERAQKDIRETQSEKPLRTIKTAGEYFYWAGSVAVDKSLHPIGENGIELRLNCAALPFLLGLNPFIQGLTSADELARTVAKDFVSYYSANKENAEQERRTLTYLENGCGCEQLP